MNFGVQMQIQDYKGATIGKKLDDCMTEWGIAKFLITFAMC